MLMQPSQISDPNLGQPDGQPPADPSIYPPAPETPHQPPAPPAKKTWRDYNWRSILTTTALLLLAPIIAWLISAFALQSYQVDGQSMQTTLYNGDRLIVDKIPRTLSRLTGHVYVPKRGDIVIFNTNQLPDAFTGGKQLIKRVVALPGERVVIKSGVLSVYNSAHPTGYNPDSSGLYHLSSTITNANQPIDLTLGSDEVYVLGDNRPNSEDSRFFGPIKASYIVGKLSFRILPLSKAERF